MLHYSINLTLHAQQLCTCTNQPIAPHIPEPCVCVCVCVCVCLCAGRTARVDAWFIFLFPIFVFWLLLYTLGSFFPLRCFRPWKCFRCVRCNELGVLPFELLLIWFHWTTRWKFVPRHHLTDAGLFSFLVWIIDPFLCPRFSQMFSGHKLCNYRFIILS